MRHFPETAAEGKLIGRKEYIDQYGEDLPEIRKWK
jgi:phosphoketolase